nr:MAG TPA: hypothetical protein [Caudoviricetes sp.]
MCRKDTYAAIIHSASHNICAYKHRNFRNYYTYKQKYVLCHFFQI